MKENIKELPKTLENINVPFKISAGPGGGKTTWLVGHIQDILRHSDRLGKICKIACITHTRIGAKTVENKIKKLSETNRMDIGTIHSFLYRNVVKPFSYLIEKDVNGETLFNVQELSGLIENRLHLGRFNSWKQVKKDEKQFYLFDEKILDSNGTTNLEKTIFYLNNITWKINDGEVFIGISKRYRPTLLINKKGKVEERGFANKHLLFYKKKCWSKGIMHHEDVLYFSWLIFNKNPRVVEFLSNKYPYLFLDEFQDTNPIQTWLIKEVAKKGTTIGVIGDPAQAIFKFAGARREDFKNFTLPNICFFKKSLNYRSTKKIISLLNNLRSADIEQKPKEGALDGDNVVVLVGDEKEAISYVRKLDEECFSVLCRYNKDVNRLRNNIKKVQGENLISLLYSEDSNYRRPVFIHSLLKAFDFYENEEYKEGIKEIKKHLKTADANSWEKRKVAIEIIHYLRDNLDLSLIDIYSYWQKKLKNDYSIKSLAGIRKPANVYKNAFKDLLPFLSKQTEISSKIRTIHQAKGAEFKNVLVCLFDKTDKNGIIKKKLGTMLNDYIFNAIKNIELDNEIGEETRLLYVAFSRAKERLFINVPRLTELEQLKLEKMGMIVENIVVPIKIPRNDSVVDVVLVGKLNLSDLED